jgi:hypothetical protein
MMDSAVTLVIRLQVLSSFAVQFCLADSVIMHAVTLVSIPATTIVREEDAQFSAAGSDVCSSGHADERISMICVRDIGYHFRCNVKCVDGK